MEITGAAQAVRQGQEDRGSNKTVAFLGPLNSYSHQV